jgi:RNA polymerase sigma-70 factor, ECF subfamily
MAPVGRVEDLFAREYERLVRSLGVAFEPEAAADAVQEAFVQADRRWAHVETMEDPSGWVRRVALNRLLNGRRNDRRREEILATIRPVSDEALIETQLDLRRAVAELPTQMRVAVCLHYLADLSVAEVAAALAVAEGTVKSNLHDARLHLRKNLHEEPLA